MLTCDHVLTMTQLCFVLAGAAGDALCADTLDDIHSCYRTETDTSAPMQARGRSKQERAKGRGRSKADVGGGQPEHSRQTQARHQKEQVNNKTLAHDVCMYVKSMDVNVCVCMCLKENMME